MNLAIPDRRYKTLKAFQTAEHGPVKIICKDGKMLDTPDVETCDANTLEAARLREKASHAELMVVSDLQKLGFAHSVPMAGYFLDFYHAGRKINIEIDGPHHKQRKLRDKNRDAIMCKLGIRVWRFRSGWTYNNPTGLIGYVNTLLNRPLP